MSLSFCCYSGNLHQFAMIYLDWFCEAGTVGSITVSFCLQSEWHGSNAFKCNQNRNHKCPLKTLLLPEPNQDFKKALSTQIDWLPSFLIFCSLHSHPLTHCKPAPREEQLWFEQFLVRFDVLKLQFWTVLEGPSVVAEGTRPLASQHQLHPHHEITGT